jgi:predicted RNA-binding protein with PUA domain
MKIHLTKRGQTRYCQPTELELMKSAGWSEVTAKPAVIKELSDDVIVVKQPVKSKGTEKTLDDAINKGDE